MGIDTNYLAVLVAALVYYAGGTLWYSKLLFGKQWTALVGLDQTANKRDVWKPFLISLIAALIISYGLARIEAYMNVITISGGFLTGFWAWFCFVLSTMATNNSFAGRPVKLLLIDGGYHLYGFLAMAVILAIWK